MRFVANTDQDQVRGSYSLLRETRWVRNPWTTAGITRPRTLESIMPTNRYALLCSVMILTLTTLNACTPSTANSRERGQAMLLKDDSDRVPPPRIQAWMDRLTVDHEYDPKTGFIVAREVIGLPKVISSGPMTCPPITSPFSMRVIS